MGDIRAWAMGVCAAAIACGVAQMILPKSGIQKVFNITISVFFLTCLFSPVLLSAGLGSLDIAPPDAMLDDIQQRATRLEETQQQQTEHFAVETVRQQARDVLESLSVYDSKIYINIHDDGMGGISISECEIWLDEIYFPRHDEIRTELKATLGVTVRIGYGAEN